MKLYEMKETVWNERNCNTHQISGSQDGHLHVWSVKTGNKIAVLEGNHPNPIGCVAFNPKYMMVASSCNNAVSEEVNWVVLQAFTRHTPYKQINNKSVNWLTTAIRLSWTYLINVNIV